MSSKQADLDAARAARTALLSGGKKSYTTALGAQVANLDLADLNALISQLEGEVAMEGLNGEGGPSRIEVGLGSIDGAQ